MNDYEEAIEALLTGERVTVLRNGESFTGWAEEIRWGNRHIVLRDVERPDGTQSAAAMISHADAIYRADTVHGTFKKKESIRKIKVEDVLPAPYAQREWEPLEQVGFVNKVKRFNGRRSFPEVYQNPDGEYELIDGHKSLWACKQAGLDKHAFAVREVTPFEAAREFVAEHLPVKEELNDDGSVKSRYTKYSTENTKAAIQDLVRRFGEEQVMQIPRVRFNYERLFIDDDDGSADGDGADTRVNDEFRDPGKSPPVRIRY